MECNLCDRVATQFLLDWSGRRSGVTAERGRSSRPSARIGQGGDGMYILLHARTGDGHTPADFPGFRPKVFDNKAQVAEAVGKLPKTHDWIVYEVVGRRTKVSKEFR